MERLDLASPTSSELEMVNYQMRSPEAVERTREEERKPESSREEERKPESSSSDEWKPEPLKFCGVPVLKLPLVTFVLREHDLLRPTPGREPMVRTLIQEGLRIKHSKVAIGQDLERDPSTNQPKLWVETRPLLILESCQDPRAKQPMVCLGPRPVGPKHQITSILCHKDERHQAKISRGESSLVTSQDRSTVRRSCRRVQRPLCYRENCTQTGKGCKCPVRDERDGNQGPGLRDNRGRGKRGAGTGKGSKRPVRDERDGNQGPGLRGNRGRGKRGAGVRGNRGSGRGKN